ncbi:MAG: ribosome biogenesis GTPase Der, partial [Candidatus Cloacimonetes bacterium]|nr:ribosome biogenesis GTPase Der [Candidatus Cloacimonadota bacterium]
SNQDKKIASYAVRNFKDIIIVFNKWDLPEKDNSTTGIYVNKVIDELPFLQYAPILFVSALTGQRVHTILDHIIRIEEESNKRIPTSVLNNFLEKVIRKYPPAHSSGKHTKIFFCTQVKSHPPTFVFFCNDQKLITKHYKKYLENQLRAEFGFVGATLRIFYRSRVKVK